MTLKEIYEGKEREVAEFACKTYIEDVVKEAGGATLGGLQLAVLYTQRMYKNGIQGESVRVAANAIAHWVTCAGYDENGNYMYRLSNYRIG